MATDQPVLVTILRRPFTCRFCRGAQFWERAVKLNTGGLEFLGVEWANKTAEGVICTTCGLVHEFLGSTIEFWQVEGGYPPLAETAPPAPT